MYIKTDRLEITNLKEQDKERMAYLLKNDIIKQTYMVPDFETEEQVNKMFNVYLRYSNSEEHYIFGIYLNDLLIGFINDVYQEEKTIEFGYALDPVYFNNGYMTEAFSAVIDFMFSNSFSEVLCGAFEGNESSVKVMIKCGMKKIDKTEEIEYRGIKHNCVYYSIKNNKMF